VTGVVQGVTRALLPASGGVNTCLRPSRALFFFFFSFRGGGFAWGATWRPTATHAQHGKRRTGSCVCFASSYVARMEASVTRFPPQSCGTGAGDALLSPVALVNYRAEFERVATSVRF